MSPAADKRLLQVPSDVEAEDDLRVDRIRAEIDAGFDAMRDVDDGVSVFGSARITGDIAGMSSVARRAPVWPATASP
jgi:hypothetical protein